ncbi:MAG: DUF2911 domain-containing protein [Bryobacterales bacterium]|nr:DUF2911 domain-containing protein [Bryobacterales bacterium]
MMSAYRFPRRLAIAGMSFALALMCVPFAATQPKDGVSPHEKTQGVIGGAKIEIEYGRPSLKGRELMGTLIPIGQVWRLGADEATKLTTPVDIEINGLKVPAGTYSLFMLVAEDGTTQLIVNKVANQWGAFKYDAAQDLGRVAIVGSRDNPVTEMLTIKIEPSGDKAGRIRFAWGDGLAVAFVKVL